MAERSKDTLYHSYLASLADSRLRDAKENRFRKTPSVWLWEKLDEATANYASCCESMANGPRNRVGRMEAMLSDIEDNAFALLLALGVEKGKLSPAFKDNQSFIVRLIDVRENEKSLEDLVYDERNKLWE